MIRLVASPIFPVLLYSLLLSGMLVGFVLAGTMPSSEWDITSRFVWSILLPLWIVRDAQVRRIDPFFDFGLYVYLFLPVAMLVYPFWSRGWRGIGMMMQWVAAMVMPYVVANLVAAAR